MKAAVSLKGTMVLFGTPAKEVKDMNWASLWSVVGCEHGTSRQAGLVACPLRTTVLSWLWVIEPWVH